MAELQQTVDQLTSALATRYDQGRADERDALADVTAAAAIVPRLQAELARTRQVGDEDS